jgi:putative ABC transport system ATP-binding protein
LFELDSVTAQRGDRVVLQDVSIDIGEGATAIVGPSGAGKSTLLRLLNRLADPVAGTVRFGGRDVRELDVLGLRRDVVLVPQMPAPLPGTVAMNVAYGPSLRGDSTDVDRWLELAGLDASYAPRDAARLSVGEQQRLMLARALALEPDALLLDEPTASLDAATADRVGATLRRLAHDGIGVCLATHDLRLAGEVADRRVDLGGAS